MAVLVELGFGLRIPCTPGFSFALTTWITQNRTNALTVTVAWIFSQAFSKPVNTLRVRHYALKTEKTYLQWIKRFILFHNKTHPLKMGKVEVEAFLTWLAVNRGVSPSTQNQALQAILFLYRKVLEIELPWLDDVVRAKPQRRIPVVLSRQEVTVILAALQGQHQLIGRLLYGSGLRLMECLRLRVLSLDLDRLSITVHSGKGGKDRVTVLPES